MEKLKQTTVLLAMIFLVGYPDTFALQCGPCDLSQCPELNCPGGIVDSPCQCCKICAKQIGEICGGIWDVEGECDIGLYCGISPDFGGSVIEESVGSCLVLTPKMKSSLPGAATGSIPNVPLNLNCSILYSGCDLFGDRCLCLKDEAACQNPFEYSTREECEQAAGTTSPEWNKEPWSSIDGSGAGDADIPEDCLQARCEIVFDIQCPGDSVKIEAVRLLGECCPEPPRCECDRSACPELLCGEGYERIIGSHGSEIPGSCCDIYECQPIDIMPDCTGIVCPQSPVTMCPKDSRLVMGGITLDGCCLTASRCDCAKDMCSVPGCWPGFAPKRLAIADETPGSCCDMYECVAGIVTQECRNEDKIYLDGESWEVDNCKTCECRGGMAHCVITQECYKAEDKELCFTPEGFKAHGDKWEQDDCTSCECLNGEMLCRMPSCATHCLNPKKVPGRCCPVCDEPTFITLPPESTHISATTSTLPEGNDIVATSPGCPSFNCTLQCQHDYKTDNHGCRQCECVKDVCPDITACDRHCLYGFRKDEMGCEVCKCQHKKACLPMDTCDKFCLYGFQVTKTGCPRCRCDRCTPIESCRKECTHGFETNDRGCQLCKCKVAGPTSTIKPTALGSCLSLDGHVFEDGESWHDGCRECYCHNGHEMCSLITCPVPACEDPVIKQGECCPSCKDTETSLEPHLSLKICQSIGGHYYVEGETWKMDACTTCVCHDGHVLCSTHSCPPLPCSRPEFVLGACCSMCPDAEEPGTTVAFGFGVCLLASGISFENGATWKEDDCTSCKCTDGQVQCYSQTCALLDCEMPVLRKGQCCPTCIDTSPVVVCEFDSMTYVDGESWDVDHCIHCMCHQGRVGCSVPDCPGVLNCDKPFLPVGECCPKCPTDEPPTENKQSTILPPVVIQEGAKPSLLPYPHPTQHHKPPDASHRNGSSGAFFTTAGPTPDVSFMPDGGKGRFPVLPVVLSILVILLAICIVLMMLLLVTKRRHRLLYHVSKKHVAATHQPPVMGTSIKKKNMDVKNSNRDAAAMRESANNRDSIRDSGCFKDNVICGKTNLDGQEIKRYQDMFAVGKTIQPV